MNDRAMQIILDYLEKDSEPPESWMSEQDFEELSLARWAAGELLNAIWDAPFLAAKDTVEEFAIKMELFALMSDSCPTRRIFLAAAQTAAELLELIEEEAS